MLEMYLKAVPIMAGLYLTGLAMVMMTGNFWSAVIFKIIPLWLGLSCLYLVV